MEDIDKLSISFFEKPRTVASKNLLNEKEIIPIKWSKEVMTGKKQVLVYLPNETSKK